MTSLKRFLADLSVGKKLYGSFALVGALFLIAIVVGWSSITSVGNTVHDGYARAVAAKQASAAAYNMHVSQIQNVTDHGKVVQMHKDDMAAFDSAVADLAKLAVAPEDHAAVTKIHQDYAAWKVQDNKVAALWHAGQWQAAADVVDGQANSASDTLSKELDDYANGETKAANAAKSSSESSAHSLMLIVALIAFAVAGGIAFLVTRTIRKGVGNALERLEGLQQAESTDLAAGLDAMAEGDLTNSVTAVTPAIENPAKDEIGQVQEAVNGIRERTIRSVDAFNAMAEKLRGLIGEVSTSAGSVSSGSQQMASTSEEAGKAVGEIASAVGDVAQGAERQVRQVESVKGSADEAATAAQLSAEQAREAAEVAQQAQEVAQEGVGAAEQATDAMRSVRDSSQSVTQAIRDLAGKSDEIGAIVETITGIAGQTNLLALNAAIEAARAGEQGRGFAVVAEEVRKLAEESQQAAEEIATLITQIQGDTQNVVGVVEDGAQRTEQGAETVEQTREAFVRIGEAVEDVSSRIAQIAGAAEQISAETTKLQSEITEVAAVAEQSSASTEQVSASTEQTSASAQEIAASAQELASTAEGLERLVSTFKVTA